VAAYVNPSPVAEPPVSAQPRFVRLLFPSVADLIFIALLASFSFTALSTRLLNDAGVGWHIRNGQQILATHSIPRTDSFSSIMSGKTWFAWEWLYDALISAIHKLAGLNGVVFFTAVLIALTFAAAFRIALHRGTHVALAVALVILAVSASTIHFFARPHVFSWLFTLIWFQLLDSAEAAPEQARRLFWLPMLTVLWANLHGGFVLGFVLLGIYVIAGALRYIREFRSTWPLETLEATKTSRWLKTLFVVLVLCLGASFVNPYGYKLHVHIYGYLTDRFLLNHIDEFRSPNFHAIAQQCFGALLLITLIAVASARTRLRTSHLLVIIFAIYSGLYASRNLPTSSILLVLVVGPLLSSAMRNAGSNPAVTSWLRRIFARAESFGVRMHRMETGLAGHVWPVAVLALGVLACAQQGRVGLRQLINAHFSDKRFPVHAVDFLSQHEVRQSIFAPDYWGGYLIYRLYPQTKVVVDDRHDFYGDEFLKDYLKVIHVQSEWQQMLDRLGVNFVLAPKESPLANILQLTPQWAVVHEGDVGVLFQRKQEKR